MKMRWWTLKRLLRQTRRVLFLYGIMPLGVGITGLVQGNSALLIAVSAVLAAEAIVVGFLFILTAYKRDLNYMALGRSEDRREAYTKSLKDRIWELEQQLEEQHRR